MKQPLHDPPAYGPSLVLWLHKHGVYVVIGNAPKPRIHPRQPWYALVERDGHAVIEHYADGATPWSALRKATRLLMKELRTNRERDQRE